MTPRRGILLVGNHPPPFGGVPSHIEALSRHLSARGWEVHVLAGVGPTGTRVVDGYHVHRQREVDKVRDLLRRPPRVGRDELLWSERGPLQMRLGLVSVANAVTRLVRTHDLQLVSAYHLLSTALPASWATRTLGVPLVTTVFGEIYAEREDHLRRAGDVRAILDASRMVLSCSLHCAESFRSIGIDDVAEVSYYGVDVERFTRTHRLEARAHLGVPQDAQVVSFVGRMVDDMGLGVLLEAAPRLIDAGIRLVLAGATGELTAAAFESRHRFGDLVMVLPDIAPELLPQVYAAADAVAAPSRNERACLGLAIAEAMASARPVVAADAGGTAEVVVDGETGVLVAPGDAEALATSLLTLLGDPSRRDAMGAAGRQRARAVFDNRVVCSQMEDRFLEVLQAR